MLRYSNRLQAAAFLGFILTLMTAVAIMGVVAITTLVADFPRYKFALIAAAAFGSICFLVFVGSLTVEIWITAVDDDRRAAQRRGFGS